MRALLFGAQYHLGKSIAIELRKSGYSVCAVVENSKQFECISSLVNEVAIVDLHDSQSLLSAFKEGDVVISCLRRNYDLTPDTSCPKMDVDFTYNRTILDCLKYQAVEKFIYISAFEDDRNSVMKHFYEELQNSRLPITFIEPTLSFRALVELIQFSLKNRISCNKYHMNRFNPICETDVAKLVVKAIQSENKIIYAGGANTYSLKEAIDMVSVFLRIEPKIITIPEWLIKPILFILKWGDKKAYDKLNLYFTLIQSISVSPSFGNRSFSEYLKSLQTV